ncbi:MAG: DUF2254 domain-containing protein [Polyangiales bacterium]
MPRWRYLLRRLARELWFRAAAYSVLGLVGALVAAGLARFVPQALAVSFGGDATGKILTVISSSMLAVTTFSLSTLVTAYTSISSSATPRAAKLLVSDHDGQNVLSTFVGAFLYSLVGLVALQTGYYGPQGRLILFLITVGVLVVVVIALIRWIHSLSRLGQVDAAISRVEAATREALESERERASADEAPPLPEGHLTLTSTSVGYVQNVDLGALRGLCLANGVRAWVRAPPGRFVHVGAPLIDVAPGPADKEVADAMLATVLVGSARSVEEDPRFGVTVLAEVAMRALSPGVNDPGTAVEVVATGVRLLSEWSRGRDAPPRDAVQDAVYLPPTTAPELLDDLVRPIATYGAGDLNVGLALQQGLRALAEGGSPALAESARHHAVNAAARAERSLTDAGDVQRLREASRWAAG